MGLVANLQSGAAGVRVALAIDRGWTVRSDDESVANIRRDGGAIEVHAMVSRAVVDLSPTHDEALREDADRCARAIFNDTFELRSNANLAPSDRRRRTDDPSWSPLVECARIEIDGQPAQRSIHRVMYEPGIEAIIGRLVIPVRRGSIELRALSVSHETGYRESTLTLLRRDKGADKEAGWPLISQAEFDSIDLDAQFAAHPLSLVRAQLASWLEPGAITIVAPPSDDAHRLAIQRVPFVIAPPIRAIASSSFAGRGFEVERFSRVELGTSEDSVLHWSVGTIDLDRLRNRSASIESLRPLFEAMHREAHGASWSPKSSAGALAATSAGVAEINNAAGGRSLRFRALERADHARFVAVYAHRGWSDSSLDAMLDHAQLDRDRA